MKAHLKEILPQEGTDNLLVRESLGGPSGSSCPSYSGEGKDRHRATMPRKEENIELPRDQESLPSCTKSSSSSASTPNENLKNVKMEMNHKNLINALYENQRSQVYKELEDMIQALQEKKQGIEKIEDKSSNFLHKYMLDSVAVIKRVAVVMGNEDKLILENAALEIKEAVEGILKLPESVEENAPQMEKTTSLIKQTQSSVPPTIPALIPYPATPASSASSATPAPPESSTPSQISAPPVSHIVDNMQLDNNKLINFLKNFFQDTINEYLDLCEEKLLDEREVKSNVNVTSSKNSSTDIASSTGIEKEKEDSCKPIATPEPIYDVWYEMDRFNDFALKCIERGGPEITVLSLFSEPTEIAAEESSKKQRSRDVLHLQRKQPCWLTTDIAELRRAYMTARRQYSRSRRRRQQDEAAEMEHYTVYRSAKRALNAAINKAKSEGREIPKVDEHEYSEDDSDNS